MSDPLHSWQLSPPEARVLQTELARQVVLSDDFDAVNFVGGVDVGFEQEGTVTRAALVVMSYPDLVVVERQLARVATSFPYVPGLLSFREMPAILQAYQQLRLKPDLLMCDGQGVAHPRRFGIACHLGVWLNLPTIGVAKKRLVGKHADVANVKGAITPLLHKSEQIGTVLRSRTGVKPLFISPGHRVSHASAVRWVTQCLTRYKLPEPTRQAHHLASLEK